MKSVEERSMLSLPLSAVVASPQGLLLLCPSLALIPCNCVSRLLIQLTGNPKAVTYVLELKGDRIRLWYFLHRALNMPKKYRIARRPLALQGRPKQGLLLWLCLWGGRCLSESERPQRTSCSRMGSQCAPLNSCSLRVQWVWQGKKCFCGYSRCWKSRDKLN